MSALVLVICFSFQHPGSSELTCLGLVAGEKHLSLNLQLCMRWNLENHASDLAGTASGAASLRCSQQQPLACQCYSPPVLDDLCKRSLAEDYTSIDFLGRSLLITIEFALSSPETRLEKGRIYNLSLQKMMPDSSSGGPSPVVVLSSDSIVTRTA